MKIHKFEQNIALVITYNAIITILDDGKHKNLKIKLSSLSGPGRLKGNDDAWEDFVSHHNTW